MYQTIGEAIQVLGIFKQASFIPKKFHWHHRIYPIEKVTSTHEVLNGGVKKRQYAILSEGNLYLLEYNRQEETWTLEQVWYEG